MANTQKYGKWKVQKRYKNNGHIFIGKHEDGRTGIIKTKKAKLKNFQRTIREINNLRKLDHPNIVSLLDYDEDSESPYLVTEYCSGGNLNGKFVGWSLEEKIRLCDTIYKATKYHHSQGVIRGGPARHIGDIRLKSDNRTPVLVDFESSAAATEENINQDMRHLAGLIWDIAGPEYVMDKMLNQDMKK